MTCQRAWRLCMQNYSSTVRTSRSTEVQTSLLMSWVSSDAQAGLHTTELPRQLFVITVNLPSGTPKTVLSASYLATQASTRHSPDGGRDATRKEFEASIL